MISQYNSALLEKDNMSNHHPIIIAIIDIPQNISSGDYFYRTYSPGVALAKKEDVYVVAVSNIHPKKSDIMDNADIVVLNDICDPDLLPVISKRKKKGLLTIYEIADDMNGLQPWNAVYEFYQNKENIALIYKLADYSDKLQFSVHELQKLYGTLNKNNEVFPNQILNTPLERSLNNSDEFIIGWGGSHGHLEDISAISDQLTKWILSKPKAKLHLMCSEPIWNLFKELPENKKKYFPTGSLENYYKFLSELHVGIAPLQDTAFNRCRSDVKFLEYAISGVIPVVADLEPYKGSVVHGETGFLFNNAVELIKTLDLIENDRNILKRVSITSKAYVKRERLQSAHVKERIEFYRSGTQPKQPVEREHADPKTLFDHWCKIEGASRNKRYLELSNTKFEKSVFSGLALVQNKSEKSLANEYFKNASRLEPQCYLPFLYGFQCATDPIAQLARAIKLAPFSIKAHLLMGEELSKQGKIIDALSAFNRAFEIFPEYEIPLMRAGNLLTRIGKHNEADQLFQRAANLQINIPSPIQI
jgi:tetratricopeptide (TPR) repeat protein